MSFEVDDPEFSFVASSWILAVMSKLFWSTIALWTADAARIFAEEYQGRKKAPTKIENKNRVLKNEKPKEKEMEIKKKKIRVDWESLLHRSMHISRVYSW